MTLQEIRDASKRIHQIQVDLWEIEKTMDKDSSERAKVLAVRVDLGKVDAILQHRLQKTNFDD